MAITTAEIARRFTPPATDPERAALKARICAKAAELALLVHELVPGSREQSIAVEAIETAVSFAHHGIDRRLTTPTERIAARAAEPVPAHDYDRAAAEAAVRPDPL
ncbi:Acb2/Tad1 domain-containing protein [Streptomyces sp. URMC 129]|uniref:Acb2/Tad1 domain-containing protein n=1 Tax=Streptomyces sp. URMC 129 TaxID=3423407 RepID=UPI003F1E28C9